MRAAFTSLMAALLFIHTLFGCCCHHAYALSPCRAAKAPERPKCCQHHQQPGDSKPENLPCQDRPECRGTCTYLIPQRVEVDCKQTAVPFDLALTLPAMECMQVALAAQWEMACCPEAPLPPLRRHLLHQILLS